MDGDGGVTLEEHLEQRRNARAPLRSEAETLAFIRPVLEELAFAHEQGVVHRDIKPANIFVASGPDGVVLKVLDFGIAKLLEGDETTSGNTMTTSALQMFSPHYGAPEQFAGKKTGKYTDVFALGLLLTKPPPLGPGERVENMQASLDKRERPTPKLRGRARRSRRPSCAASRWWPPIARRTRVRCCVRSTRRSRSAPSSRRRSCRPRSWRSPRGALREHRTLRFAAPRPTRGNKEAT